MRKLPAFSAACVVISLALFSACGSDSGGTASGGAGSGQGGSGPSVGGNAGTAGSSANGGSHGGQAGAPATGGTSSGDSGAAGEAGTAGTSLEPPGKTALQPLPVDGFYPRVLKRANGTIVASVVAGQKSGNLGGTILESTDDGLTFQVIGHIDEPLASGGLCCGTLYELPHALGALPAGTLLWSASVGSNQKTEPMKLPVWSSADGGRTWSPLSTIIGPFTDSTHRSVWEPEFSLLDDGTLVCHFSDETDPKHSQKLVAVRTTDGKIWSAPKDTVALSTFGYRPGMAVVRRAPSGVFFMSYEVCGVPGDSCAAHVRTSPDGWDWGTATDIGDRPVTVDGKHFLHAPTIMWSDAPSQLGRLFLVGQVATDTDGNPAAENGNFVMVNAQGGKQFWYGIEAPVLVNPAPYDNFCPNYSSPLVALDGGRVGLELASRWDGKICRTYFARGPLLGSGDATGIIDGEVYHLVNVTSGLCLEVVGDSTQAHALVEQTTCATSALQDWAISAAANGAFSIKAQNSVKCLAPAGSEKNGTLIEQNDCDGSAAQSWNFRAVGPGYFELVEDGGACLDNPAASTKPGTNFQLWTCNDLSPQIWHLELQK